MQKRQAEWDWEWKNYDNATDWLFSDWIWPNTLESFRNKRVLDAGVGGGNHILLVAPYAREVVGVDLNAAATARSRTQTINNISIIEGDIATILFSEKFDVVYCVGVIHHTQNPDTTFQNLARLTAKNGRVIIWVYAHEGNFLNRVLLEPFKKLFFQFLPRPILKIIALVITTILYLPIYSIYMLPLRFLPFYQYFENWRRLNFAQNDLNVFDKLNAPITHFIPRRQIEKWFNQNEFRDVHISKYVNVGWRASGTKI